MCFPKANHMAYTDLFHRPSTLLSREHAKRQHTAYLLFAMPFSTLPSIGMGHLSNFIRQGHFRPPMYSLTTSILRWPSSAEMINLAARSSSRFVIFEPKQGASRPVRSP